MSYEIGRNWETDVTPRQRAMRRAALLISAVTTAVALFYWFA